MRLISFTEKSGGALKVISVKIFLPGNMNNIEDPYKHFIWPLAVSCLISSYTLFTKRSFKKPLLQFLLSRWRVDKYLARFARIFSWNLCKPGGTVPILKLRKGYLRGTYLLVYSKVWRKKLLERRSCIKLRFSISVLQMRRVYKPKLAGITTISFSYIIRRGTFWS